MRLRFIKIYSFTEIKTINLKKKFENYQMSSTSDKMPAETGMETVLGRREQQWINFHFYDFYPERRPQLVTEGDG